MRVYVHTHRHTKLFPTHVHKHVRAHIQIHTSIAARATCDSAARCKSNFLFALRSICSRVICGLSSSRKRPLSRVPARRFQCVCKCLWVYVRYLGISCSSFIAHKAVGLFEENLRIFQYVYVCIHLCVCLHALCLLLSHKRP